MPDSNPVDVLRQEYPHGHPDFIPMTVAEMDLHSRKNKDYAQGGDPLGNFHRVATILSLYPGLDPSDPAVVAQIYSLKQWDAYMWMKCQRYEGGVEGKAARMGDVSVYAKLTRIVDSECNLGEPKPQL